MLVMPVSTRIAPELAQHLGRSQSTGHSIAGGQNSSAGYGSAVVIGERVSPTAPITTRWPSLGLPPGAHSILPARSLVWHPPSSAQMRESVVVPLQAG